MHKTIIFFWSFLLLLTSLFAQKSTSETIIQLPQLIHPNFITAGNGYLVISEDSSRVHVFRLQNDALEPLTVFGREGQGPGEFDFIHRFRILPDGLEIPTRLKYARFSFDGKLIEEKRILIPVFKNLIFRIKDHYVASGMSLDKKEIITNIQLYGPDLNPVCTIGTYRYEGDLSRINLMRDIFSLRVYNDSVYLCTSNSVETTIEAFDIQGKSQSWISLPLKSLPVTEMMKEQYTWPMREGPENKADWKEYENRIFFPESTPGLDDLFIQEEKLICRSHNRRDGLVEFVFFDLKGREITRAFMFDCGRNVNGCLYCFNQGDFCYLKDNAEEEVWELHIKKMY